MFSRILTFAPILCLIGASTLQASSPPCSKEVRLDGKGGPFENSPTQNQSGLGVCYANTASRLVQSILPGHPEISYLDLAAQTRELGTALLPKPVGDTSNERPDFWFEKGEACAAFNTAKNLGACPRDQVSLEGLFYSKQGKKLELEQQEKVIWNFGEFLDEYQKLSEIDRFTFRERLQKKWKQTEDQVTCGPEALQKAFEIIYLGSPQVSVTVRNLIPAHLQSEVEKFKIRVPLLLNQDKSGEEILKLLFRKLKVPGRILSEFVKNSPLTYENLSLKVTEAGDSDRCRVLALLSEMQINGFDSENGQNSSFGCADCAMDSLGTDTLLQKNPLNRSLFDLINYISKTTLPTKPMVDKMLQPEEGRIRFKSAFWKSDPISHQIPGLECKGERLRIPPDYSCEQVVLADNKMQMTDRIEVSLQKMQPVAVTIHPQLLEPRAGTFAPTDLHSVTIAGYRDEGSLNQCRRSYLILNSAGADCSIYGRKIRHNCDPESGKFWIPQDELLKMMTDVSFITQNGSNSKN